MDKEYKIKKDNLIYPELSFKIVGVLFDAYNELGYGYQEKYYQKAISVILKESKLTFKEQVYFPIKIMEEKIGNYYFDFLIEDKIVLEIKKDEKFKKKNVEQVYSYLKSANLKLGILANFTKNGVKYMRILNT